MLITSPKAFGNYFMTTFNTLMISIKVCPLDQRNSHEFDELQDAAKTVQLNVLEDKLNPFERLLHMAKTYGAYSDHVRKVGSITKYIRILNTQ
jgi:hypothetical protein